MNRIEARERLKAVALEYAEQSPGTVQISVDLDCYHFVDHAGSADFWLSPIDQNELVWEYQIYKKHKRRTGRSSSINRIRL